jgi:hypothetical protein
MALTLTQIADVVLRMHANHMFSSRTPRIPAGITVFSEGLCTACGNGDMLVGQMNPRSYTVTAKVIHRIYSDASTITHT